MVSSKVIIIVLNQKSKKSYKIIGIKNKIFDLRSSITFRETYFLIFHFFINFYQNLRRIFLGKKCKKWLFFEKITLIYYSYIFLQTIVKKNYENIRNLCFRNIL